MNVFRQVGKMAVLKNSEFAIKLVARLAGAMSHQIMDPTVNEIVSVLPRLRHTTRFMVMFENPGFIAVHPSIATGGQSSQSSSDDDDGFFSHVAASLHLCWQRAFDDMRK